MARSPLKSILTLATVGIGVGVLIFALGMSSTFNTLMDEQLAGEGIVANYANAEFNTEGELELVRPPQGDEFIVDIISAEISGVIAVTPVTEISFNEFVVHGTTYRIRSMLGANEAYGRVMDLEMIAGVFYDKADVEEGNRKAVITEGLAEILFGSPSAAIGGILQPPAFELPEEAQNNQRMAERMRGFSDPYEVIGVYKDPTELQRKSYGIGDMIVPYTSSFGGMLNAAQASRFFSGRGVLLTSGVTFETVEAQLREVLTRNYGDDFALEVWEGSPSGSSDYLAEMRSTVDTFSLVVNLLGFILLAAASIGILSIMLVEALGRSREIALERALGASKAVIIREFFARSTVVSLISVIIGVGLAFLLSGPLTDLILPIFSGIDAAQVGSVITFQSVLVGAVSAVVIGGVFGVFPVFSVLNVGIADAIREG
jgi:putative ABC transport system permease protein